MNELACPAVKKDFSWLKMRLDWLIFLPADIILINLVFVLGFLIRFGSLTGGGFASYLECAPVLSLIYLVLFLAAGIYKRRFPTYWDLFQRLAIAILLGALCVATLLYMFRQAWSEFPSSVVLITCPLGLFVFFMVKAFLLRWLGRIRRRVVILGRNELPHYLRQSSATVETRYISSIDELGQDTDIDEIVICKHVDTVEELNLLGYLALKLRINFVLSPQVYAELLSRNIIAENYIKFITTFWGKKAEHEEFLIRCFDIAGSIFFILLTAPVMMMACLLVKLTSRGPVFYTQKRAGKDGRIFVMYKFRTMVNDAEQMNGLTPAVKNDPRVTFAGRLFRKTRVDELPQLFNVLIGQMSLVGPRPENVPRIKEHEALRGLRLAVKPGITGLAQIRGGYHLDPRHKRKFDCLYIQNRSFALNMYVLVKTIPIVLSCTGV